MPCGSVEFGAAARKAAALLFAALVAVIAGCSNPMLRGGSMHFEAGRFEKAAELFRDAVAKKPLDPEAHLWLARTYSELGRVNDAVAQYERAADLDRSIVGPVNHYRLHYWRVALTRGEGLVREAEAMKPGSQKTARLLSAEKALLAAAAFSPGKALTDYQLSRLYEARGETARARRHLETAFMKAESDREAAPVLLPILRKRGEDAVLDSRYREALVLYERAARIKPDDPQVLGDLAATELLIAENSGTGSGERRSAYLEAARLLERLRKMKPDDPDALYNLATVRSRLGQPASADSLLRTYMNLRPRDPDGYILLQEVAADLGRTEVARTADIAAQGLDSGPPVQNPAEWARGAYEKYGPSSAAGHVYSQSGAPEEIRTLKKKSGDLIEIWFYFSRGRVAAFQNGAALGAVLSFGRS